MATTTVSTTPSLAAESRPTLVRGLSLLDTVLLLVGGVIGSSIFLTAKDIAGPLPHPVLFLLVWVLGAVISLFACFAFSELAAMFPHSGGQYVYMREAYGDFPAFLYGWMMFAVGNCGAIAALAVGAAAYLGAIVPTISQQHVVLSLAGVTLTRAHLVALLMIAGVTGINIVGLRPGALLQNAATWAKFCAIAAFVVLGFAVGKGDWHHLTASPPNGLMMGASSTQLLSAFGVALIAVFWAYDGWVYVTWVSDEVKEPRRNLPLAMVVGTLIVAVVYIAMNTAYLYAMPIGEITQHETIAHDVAIALFSPAAATWLSALIALSIFGALACAILACPRIYYAMALDGLFFRRMGEVHPKWRTPAFALIGQAIWASILTLSGRYDQLYTYVMFGMILSYTLTVVGLFILRRTRPDAPRPYRCTGYPWLPAIYVLVAGAWTLNTVFTRPKEALAGMAIILVGVPHYWYWKRTAKRS
ncbi:MAG TPA: amino acid permease [Terriglobales bacterium]|nr:amino acid permease [Terriglobales bacterium]